MFRPYNLKIMTPLGEINFSNEAEESSLNFPALVRSVERHTFDSNRMSAVRYIDCALTCSQIEQVLEKFTFDKERINAARHLFPKCADKHNWFMLGQAFTWDSSQKDLREISQ